MKFFDFFKKAEQEEDSSLFSGFFLHASEKEKEEIIKEAAYKANEEQKRVFARSRALSKINKR